MPTLYDRFRATTPEELEEGQQADPALAKIGTHAYTAVVVEYFLGKFTGAEAKAMFSLDTAQTADTIRIKNLIQDSPSKEAFMRSLKNVFYLMEVDLAYTVEADFWTRLEAIVTDQGGTVT